MLIKRLIITLTMALVLAPSLAPAQVRPMGPAHKWWRAPRAVQVLGLTPQEINRLERLHMDLRQKEISQRSLKDQARLRIDMLFEAEPLDEAAIEKQFATLSRAQTALTMERSRFLLQVRKLLGRQRFEALKALFNEYRRGARRPPRPRRW